MGLNYIPDGCTRQFVIAPEPGLHDGLTGNYRPLFGVKRATTMAKLSEVGLRSQGDAETMAAVVSSQHVIDWDLVDDKGKPCPVTPDAVLHLQPALGGHLFGILIGTKPSLLPKDKTLTERTIQQIEDELRGLDTEEARLGNLPGA